MRAAVVRAIGQRGAAPDIAKVEPVMNDGNDGVRLMAAAAVVRLSEPARPSRRAAKKTPVQPSAK